MNYTQGPHSTGVHRDPSHPLHQIGLLSYLSQDLRPTFILDLEAAPNGARLEPIFYNPVLRISRCLTHVIKGLSYNDGKDTDCIEYQEFKAWAMQSPAAQATNVSLHFTVYKDILWKGSTLSTRWRIISGSKSSLVPVVNSYAHATSFLGYQINEMPNYFTSRGLDLEGLVDFHNSLYRDADLWNVKLGSPKSEHMRWFAGLDWSLTSLGRLDTWPKELQTLTQMVMADSNPAVLFWGGENIMIYNDLYAPLLGEKHPDAMGSVAAITLREVWEFVEALLEQGRSTANPVSVESTLFWLNRFGYKEETYFSSTFVPLLSSSDTVVGFYESVTEVTNIIIKKRRTKLIEKIKEFTDTNDTIEIFWLKVLDALQSNHDICYASIFSPSNLPDGLNQDGAGDTYAPILQMVENIDFRRWAEVTLPHDCQPSKDDLVALMPVFQDILTSRKRMILPSISTVQRHLSEDQMLTPSHALCPVELAEQAQMEIMLIRTSPFKAFDHDYRDFVDKFCDTIIESMKSLSLSQLSQEKAAAIARENEEQQARLNEEIQKRTLEARKEETKFARLAESAPVGIFIGRTSGSFIFRNTKWYQILQVPIESANEPFSWLDLVHEHDQERVMMSWQQIATSRETVSFELKLKRPYTPPEVGTNGRRQSNEPSFAWVLLSIQAEDFTDEDEEHSFVGIITDISYQKWAEEEQIRRKDDALESKRQQEAFVDMVSHEIRNPLSAILISADSIEKSLSQSKYKDHGFAEDTQSNLEATNVIQHCVQHQRRIVDDILSISKMDSNLLSISPVKARPLSVAQEAMNMLSAEARSVDVTIELQIEASYHKLNIDYVMLDPNRLTQVIINLLTNAIKFTKDRPSRKVTVTIGASLQRPDDASHNVTAIRAKPKQASELVLGDEWGAGTVVYIHFGVLDTGRGLNKGEMKILFQRFSQASARTHIEYGGSGLGLFISRELVEKQGGEIGVSSTEGVGSKFAFYITTRMVIEKERANSDSRTLKQPLLNSRSSSGANSPHPENYKVLIVEDNLVNQMVLSKQLKSSGCTVYVANHGGEALDFLATTKWWSGNGTSGKELSVILMDQEMPVMDGLTCIGKIREMENQGLLTGRVPIIAVTANARPQQIAVLRDAGMDDVLLKPFRMPDLMGKLEDVASRMQLG